MLENQLKQEEIEIKQLSEINEFSKKRLSEFTPKVWKYDEIYEKFACSYISQKF